MLVLRTLTLHISEVRLKPAFLVLDRSTFATMNDLRTFDPQCPSWLRILATKESLKLLKLNNTLGHHFYKE